MTTNIATVDVHTPVAEIAKTMKDRNIGSVPICHNGKVVGIVTDRDIVLREIAEGKNTNVSKAEDVMSTGVSTIDSNTDIHEAVRIMADKQIRRLPVVDNGTLVGMLALGDVAVTNRLGDNAGEALSDISVPSHHTFY